MSIFDWFRPLDKVIDIVDKAVPDKDRANEIKAELSLAQMQLRAMAEETYRAELQTVTIPWVDSLHKMSRTILSVLNLFVGGGVIIYLSKQGQKIDLEVMTAIMAMSSPSAIYAWVKGKGAQIK